MPLLTGGSYAIATAVLLYADYAGLTPEDLRFPLLLGWAVFGGVLAIVSIFAQRHKDD